MQEIHKIVATGGPGGGKSGLAPVRKHFEALGYRVVIVPEVATEFFMSGLEIEESGLTNEKFQEGVIREQIRREDRYTRLALDMSGEKKLLIFERGILDSICYIGEQAFTIIMNRLDRSIVQLRDERYDAVFHLESAAVGAPEFYTTANNPARKESCEEAADRDMRTRQAWVGHPHLRVIKSEADFNIKIHNLIHGIERVLGIPEPIEMEKKYLIALPNLERFIATCNPVAIKIEQAYLKPKKSIRQRIRKRGQDGYFTYYLTTKEPIGIGVNREIERRISYGDYHRRLEHSCDPTRELIRKTRYCFLWASQYFELDLIHQPERYENMVVLEIELDDISQKVTLPPLNIYKEITGNQDFYNAALARKV